MWRHFACNLKKEDVGYCGKLFGGRGSGLLAVIFLGGNGEDRYICEKVDKYGDFICFRDSSCEV